MSLLKRIFGEKDEGSNNNASHIFRSPQNGQVKSMGQSLQKKFSRGVQYNMKIIIRGDRNVGKSALLCRLKGQDFKEQYIPTDEIEVASIHWNYKNLEDVVKVEVWDVVDKGRKKKNGGLKFENSEEAMNANNICLDANFLDVYKGCHGVLLMFDMTKLWTLQYVERELPMIPEDIPVLILGNHRDMGHHRTISSDQVSTLIEPIINNSNRIIRYWESSMKNGYGLVYIHRFLGIPFLKLQKSSLLAQLQTNEEEMKMTQYDLNGVENNPESAYDTFIDNLKSAKQLADRTSSHSRSNSTSQESSTATSTAATNSNKKTPNSLGLRSSPNSQINSPISPNPLSATTPDPQKPVIHVPQARPIPGMERLGLYPLPVPGSNQNTTQDEGHSDKNNPDENDTESQEPSRKKRQSSTQSGEMYDFIPPEEDSANLSSFLGDDNLAGNRIAGVGIGLTTSVKSKPNNNSRPSNQHKSVSSSKDLSSDDEESSQSRPAIVSAFQDELDDDDVVIPAPILSSASLMNTHNRHDSASLSSSSSSLNATIPNKKLPEVKNVEIKIEEQVEPNDNGNLCTRRLSDVVQEEMQEYSDLDQKKDEQVVEKKSKKKMKNKEKVKKSSKNTHLSNSDNSEPNKETTKKKSKKKSSKSKADSSNQSNDDKQQRTNQISFDKITEADDSEDALEKFLNE